MSLSDVAKAAGVHSSTVSRALTRPEAVNIKTRERILRIAAELGYRVNPLGQALRRGTSMLIPLIVPDITNPFYGELAKAIAAVAGPRGYQLVLCVTEGVPGQTSAYLASMDALFSPFAIVAPSTKLDVDALGKATLAKRLIVIDRVPPELDVPTVSIDNRLGVRLSFAHLLELGHRNIAYLTGTVGTYSGQERLDEFRIHAKANGLVSTVLNGGYGPEPGRAAAEQFLALSRRPTAVIASNDMAAFGFMSQVSERGVRIPEDLSITGFDGVAIGATFNPSITTVAQPLAELGRRAIEVAERFVSTGIIEHELLVPKLLIRRSTRRVEAVATRIRREF